MIRWLLVTCSLSAAPALALDHLEAQVNPFAVFLTAPQSEAGVSRVYATTGSATLFVWPSLGVRLSGGAAWFRALHIVAADFDAVTSPVLLPSWQLQGGPVWRFQPMPEVLWLDAHLQAGITGMALGLSQRNGLAATVWSATQAAVTVGLTANWRTEKHVAISAGVALSLYGGGEAQAAGCSAPDLARLASAERQGTDLASVAVTTGCDVAAFKGQAGSATIAAGVLQSHGAFLSGALSVELGFSFFP